MKHHKGIREVVLLFLSMAALALAVSGRYDWRWGQPVFQHEDESCDINLTDRNGSRAADMWSQATSDVYARAIFEAGHYIWVLPVLNGDVEDEPVLPDADATGERPCLLISTGRTYVGALWYKQSSTAWFCSADWADSYDPDWVDPEALSDGTYNAALALGEGYTTQDAPYTYACYRANPTGQSDGVWFRMTYGKGGYWETPVQISTDPADQIAVSTGDPINIFVAYHYVDAGTHKVKVWKSTDWGHANTWTQVSGSPWEGVAQPSIAVKDGGGSYAAVCWVKAPTNGDPTEGGKVWACLSDNFFYSHYDPVAVGGYSSAGDMVYNAPTMSIVPTGLSPHGANLVMVSELLRPGNQDPREHWLSATSGLFGGGSVDWQQYEHLMPNNANVADEDANPCVDACIPYEKPPKAYCFYTAPGDAYRALYRLDADYVPSWLPLPPAQADGVGRRIWLDSDGTVSYAARAGANVHAGPVLEDNSLQPILVDGGGSPALAVDGDGHRWISYVRDDTVRVMLGDGSYRAVFAGDSTAVPGQSSIFCPPNLVNQKYQAHVVFAVYNAVSDTSHILYAKLDADSLVLDTIATSNSLSESLPCVSSDTLGHIFVTWQDADSVMAASLDYDPGDWDLPDETWQDTTVASAGTRHPMSVLQGDSIRVIWARDSASVHTVFTKSCPVANGILTGWTSPANQGFWSDSVKTNPVVAGSGVSIWQEMVGGDWAIRGSVRGDTVTMVTSNDGAYHPHAIAESSGTGPSVNSISVKLLYTEGTVFEVDSGVYDTGVTKYVVKEYPVSNAATSATQYNNGCKLLNKAGTDSMLAVYEDTDGSVVYAWSADGDSWQREVVVQDREWPAIAEDSSGKRWVVVHKVNQLANNVSQEAYYRDSTAWTGPQTLYTSQQNRPLGPASLAGASDTATGIAYAAFLADLGFNKAIVLAKFDGVSVSTFTVALGMKLADPALAVEPYSSDSDRIHVTWGDNGVVKYRMDTDGRGQSIASNWTSTINLSSTMVASGNPCIAADRNQVVAAWAQGDTTDIYCRKRSTDSAYNNWESAANLSNTAGRFSVAPTIAMGDTVVVAWEERRSDTDYDVLACIDFGDTINIADDSTKSSYPHVVFQKSDTIPYVSTIWTDEPLSGYFEVRCNKLNLKQSGDGQQGAGKVPVRLRPSLSACRPNPFRDRTQIAYSLPSAGNVSLRVYDVTGRTVRTLASGYKKPGAYSVNWDSRDSRGRMVPHGVYFYRLDTPGFRDVKKAVVAR
jgi:hypothetical protein